MRKALIAVAIVAVAVPVAVLLMYGGTGIPGEVDPVASKQDTERETHFATDPSIHDVAVSQAAGVMQGEPAVIPGAIAAANNGFAVDFYREVSAEDGNIFFSPTSMFVAFSALYEGARGNTADQMQQVFGFEPDLQARYNATAHLMSSVNRDDPNATLEMANALWPAVQFAPYDSYINTVRDVYLADVERVDFADGGVDRINSWASEKTHGKIEEVLTPDAVDANTFLVITNSIYFNGSWAVPFPEEDTVNHDFWKRPSESVKTDFMRVQDRFDYASLDGTQIIRMPYVGDRLSMLVILPNDKDWIGSLESGVSAGQMAQWKQSMQSHEVSVFMPKFTMETSYSLPAYLGSLGMVDIFDDGLADLSGIAPVEPNVLYVSEATQVAYVDVNEVGTEAAAITAGILALVSEQPPPPMFIANHPFIFIIQDDESGAILFMGRLSDPTA